MKSLSKYLKVALCFMAFALCSFMFAFTPTLTAVDAINYAVAGYDVAINALKMPTEVVDYSSTDSTRNVFRVPYLKTVLNSVSATYKIRVVDPSGSKHDFDFAAKTATCNGKDDANFFDATTDPDNLIVKAKNDGDYKIIYITTETTGSGENAVKRTYYSNSYEVSVVNVSYELDFTTPVVESKDGQFETIGYVKNLIPTHMAVSTNKYTLPVAYAKIVGKDLTLNDQGKVKGNKATIRVTKDGAPQTENADDGVFTSDENGYYITPSEAGVYTVEYSYKDSANRPTKTFTINVEEGYVASDIKLASVPTIDGWELGKEITLPNITVNNEKAKNVDVNIESIEIVKAGSNGAIKCILNNNNREFKLSPENFTGVSNYADMKGTYHVTYKVKDANGKTLTETFKVDGVTISSKPTIQFAYDFTAEGDFKDTIKFGAEAELKSEYDSDNSGFMMPAAYVTDQVANSYVDNESLIVIRAIRKGSTYYYIDNIRYDETTKSVKVVESDETGYNKALVGITQSNYKTMVDTTKAQKFVFNKDTNLEGTYYVEYRVISRNVETRENNLYMRGTKEKYTFKLVETPAASTPTLEVVNPSSGAYKKSETVTVEVNSSDTKDSRLLNGVFTYIAKNTEMIADRTMEKIVQDAIVAAQTNDGYKRTTNVLENELFITEMRKSFTGFDFVEKTATDKYDIDLSDEKFNSATKIYVMAVALNDNGNVATETREFTIKNTDDSTAPVIKLDETSINEDWLNPNPANVGVKEVYEFMVGQGEKVTLPTVYIEDEDTTLTTNVMYYIDNPENSFGGIEYRYPVGKSFYRGEVDGRAVTFIKGGTITTSETGVYYVAYSATDVAGNTSVMYFTFTVYDTSSPILTVTPTVSDVTISGNTITGGKGTVVDFKTTLMSADRKSDYTNDSDANIAISIDDGGKGLDFRPSGVKDGSYVFNSYGEYTITVTASYQNAHGDVLKADSQEIRVVIEKQSIEWLGEFDIPSYASTNETIYLPDVKASGNAVVSVKYQTPGSTSDEAKDATKFTDDNGYTYWTFTTGETSKGTYTVTYTATNNDGKITKSVSIKVGDNVAPKISMNAGATTQDLIYDGENQIEYIVSVNKDKKTFVVKAINNGKEIYNHNIGLVISDKDDKGDINTSISWFKLNYELVGVNGETVTAGSTTTTDGTTTKTYYIKETGKYNLKLTMTDGYENTTTDDTSIVFKVLAKAAPKEKNDTVVGTVLIIISLVLLAGVIVFFTFTGKKNSVKTKKMPKQPKGKKEVEEAKVDEVGENADQITIDEISENNDAE